MSKKDKATISSIDNNVSTTDKEVKGEKKNYFYQDLPQMLLLVVLYSF